MIDHSEPQRTTRKERRAARAQGRQEVIHLYVYPPKTLIGRNSVRDKHGCEVGSYSWAEARRDGDERLAIKSVEWHFIPRPGRVFEVHFMNADDDPIFVKPQGKDEDELMIAMKGVC